MPVVSSRDQATGRTTLVVWGSRPSSTYDLASAMFPLLALVSPSVTIGGEFGACKIISSSDT